MQALALKERNTQLKARVRIKIGINPICGSIDGINQEMEANNVSNYLSPYKEVEILATKTATVFFSLTSTTRNKVKVVMVYGHLGWYEWTQFQML